MAQGVVVVVGDVMTDVIAKMTQPVQFGTDTTASCSTVPGGSAANLAAWLAPRGQSVHFVGCVGDDVFGRAHLEAFARAGITTHCAIDPAHRTGMIIVLVNENGDRTMITDRGANCGLTPADLPHELFHAGNWLHLSGYTLLDQKTRDAALDALRMARELGMGISVDPSSTAPLAAAGPGRFLEWTRGIDLCFPNLDEGRLLTGQSDEEAIARALCRWYGGVALKLGSRGAIWASGDDASVIRQDAVTTPAVDTTGAGDAFCAGFLAAWLAGTGPLSSLAQAVQLASLAAGRLGARPPGDHWGL